jgi:GT2 family glycosyltransferase
LNITGIKSAENTADYEVMRIESAELIGIVTVLFNSDDVLLGFFESLRCQRSVRYRLYIIDNSKTDTGSRLCRELAELYAIEVVIVFNDANVGVARGNNQGIERALSDGCTQVLLSNNDIEFIDPDLIVNMAKFAKDLNAEAVVPKIYYYSDRKRIWCAGGRFSQYAATTPHIGDGEIDCGQYDTARVIDYAPTCFMLLRADVFSQVGMMDERYFVYYDDVDFMWRMKSVGKQLHYWPQGQVWHKVSFSTGGSESLFSLYYGFRNRIIFIRKNYTIGMRALSIAYIYATLIVKCMRYEQEQRDAIFRGLNEGFAIQL